MSELADMLFADLEIESAAEQVLPTVKVSSASRSEARSTMKKILAGQIDVNSLDIRMESLRHLRPGVSLETVRTITKQLGFTPRNLVDVSCYHPYLGHPQVLELYPLNVKDPTVFDDRDTVQIPFPTTFWISCPILHAEISQHEENGMVLQLTNRLLHESDSQAHLEAMEAAHRAYAEERWALLTPEDREFVVASGWYAPSPFLLHSLSCTN